MNPTLQAVLGIFGTFGGLAALATVVFAVKTKREADEIKVGEAERKERLGAVEVSQASLMQSIQWSDQDREKQRAEIDKLRKDILETDLVIERMRLRMHEGEDRNRGLKQQLSIAEQDHARQVTELTLRLHAAEEDCLRRLQALHDRVGQLEKDKKS
jgi:septal ring factor EnvC (AmiA/AmiB activator)